MNNFSSRRVRPAPTYPLIKTRYHAIKFALRDKKSRGDRPFLRFFPRSNVLRYQLCREQAGLFSPAAFDEWMKKNRLSLSTAAEALGMTRRMIAHYRSGSKPIPKTVQLACIGWDALNHAA